jgi:ATP synthase protein I
MAGKNPTAERIRPERVMVRRGVVLGALAAPFALAAGSVADGWGGGLSSLIALAVVVANFAAHGLSLAWAAGVSIAAVQAVALAGFVVRMAAIVGLLFALDTTAFFSPAVFGITVAVGTLGLLSYEARLVRRGLGGELDLPPDPAAMRAGDLLREKETVR